MPWIGIPVLDNQRLKESLTMGINPIPPLGEDETQSKVVGVLEPSVVKQVDSIP
uniref:Uncharacterized protein n=1 Tax=Rhizophora mucronata TaxID=61149 RepID=A0A2P2L975_RHIMU